MHTIRAAGLLAAFALPAGPAHAGVIYTFTPIADTSGSAFSGFLGAPTINGAGVVGFAGTLRAGGSGVYTGSGGLLTTIADTSRGFAGFGQCPTISATGSVTFLGLGAAPGTGGIYVGSGGPLTTIADLSGSFGNFTSFTIKPAINAAGVVAFQGDLAGGRSGIFTGTGGALTTISDTFSTSPAFRALGPGPAINAAGAVAFLAIRDTGIEGVYVGSGGPIATIADTSGAFGPIIGFRPGLGLDPAINGAGTVVFAAIVEGGEAIFTGDGGPLTTVADTSGPYSFMGTSSINDSGMVVFLAGLDSGGTGVFTGPDPERDRALAVGDHLFGSRVTLLFYDHFGVNNAGQIAIRVVLEDGREVIVRADPVSTVPEPASLALWGLGAACLVGYGWRRGKSRGVNGRG